MSQVKIDAPTHRSPGGASYLAPLTGIRGIAALAVLLLHLNMAIEGVDFGAYLPVIYRGYLGVDLFFILSGFIICHVYAARFERWSWGAYGEFMRHRFARLYPMHLFVLLVLAVMVLGAEPLGFVLNNPESWLFADWPAHLLLVHAWGVLETATWNAPAWSISAEWLAYFVFPLAAALVRPVRSPAIGIMLCVLVLGALAAIFAALGSPLDQAWTGVPVIVRVLLEFLAGCLIYRTFLALGRPSPVWDICGAGALILYALAASYYPNDFVMVGLIALFVLATSRSAWFLRAFLASRAMVFLGEISYSIYMIHFAFILVLTRAIAAAGFRDEQPAVALALLLGSIFLVIGLSAIAFRLIERPGRTFLRSKFSRPALYATARR